MTVCKRKKYMSVFYILGTVFLLTILVYGNVTKAADTTPKVSVYMENTEVDKTLKEIVFRVKNKSNKKIRITAATIEKKVEGQWLELQRKDDSVVKRNVKVKSWEKFYDSILINQVYQLNDNNLDYGDYRIHITYRYDGVYYHKYRKFYIVKDIMASENQANTVVSKAPTYTSTSPYMPPKYSETEQILLNSDFHIDNRGKVSAVVFSESDYKVAVKTKLKIKIQRKYGKKWKNYKKYKVTKKSNIAYANKTFHVKHSGTYRMKVEIIIYKKNKQTKTRTYKSLKQKYRKS